MEVDLVTWSIWAVGFIIWVVWTYFSLRELKKLLHVHREEVKNMAEPPTD